VGDGRSLIPIASTALGMLGAVSIPILFPDLTVALAVSAIVSGGVGWMRGRSSRSARVRSATGILLGIALLVVVLSGVFSGEETKGGGGPADRAVGNTTLVIATEDGGLPHR
jgi:hypothetical protein